MLSFALILGVVIIIHELGHYWVGRLCGAAMEAFSIGFGSTLVERQDKRGTRWKISALPLGGYVKFSGEQQTPADELGDRVPDHVEGRAYTDLSPWSRIAISLGGPFANFILAILVFAAVAILYPSPDTRFGVAGVLPGSPAAEAGFEAGDVVTSVAGRPANDADLVFQAIALSADSPLLMTVDRGGSSVDLSVTPERVTEQNALGQWVSVGKIGVSIRLVPVPGTADRPGPVEALGSGVARLGQTLEMTQAMLVRIFVGKESVHQLSGPVAVADTGRRVANITLGRPDASLAERGAAFAQVMLVLMALVSVGVGFFNLLPIPVLDGGHVVFHLWEGITGAAVPAKIQEASLTIGIVLLLGVGLLVTFGDVAETGIFGSFAP